MPATMAFESLMLPWWPQQRIAIHFLPDKTIDLAEEAISALRLQQDSKPDVIREFDREITTLQIELELLRKEMKYGKGQRSSRNYQANERRVGAFSTRTRASLTGR
jgi:ATP-dependent Clp protease ATP-binding subunit ClpA